MNRNKRGRGIAMVVVLVALLLLTVLASGFFLQARDSSTLSNVAATQTVALSNAEMGLQEAVRRLRAAQIPPVQIMNCTSAQVDANNNVCPGSLLVGPITGTGPNLLNGGGLQYQFTVYHRATDPLNRHVVRVVGFFGTDINSENLITSVLEAEVEIGTSAGQVDCSGGYECNGGSGGRG
ncbi:MAG: hypothetical protein Q8S33_37085 [Myxococcales bacterium]|nr:hypothetical protein [Myxococcales bacterium]